MRLTPSRQKNRPRPRAPRIAISQAEITADLNYRGGSAMVGADAQPTRSRTSWTSSRTP